MGVFGVYIAELPTAPPLASFGGGSFVVRETVKSKE